jgi:CheY-like chemotaxis protein
MSMDCIQRAATGRANGGAQINAKRILVVDDDPVTRGLVADLLDGVGHYVETATDGESAWKALLNRNFDLLVTDDLMPKASGLALVRRIRVAKMALPIVLASDRLDLGDVARMNRDPWSRFDVFLSKPYSLSGMLHAVERCVCDRECV